MTTDLESFPHFGEHCANDERLISLTFWLMALFAVTITPLIVYLVMR